MCLSEREEQTSDKSEAGTKVLDFIHTEDSVKALCYMTPMEAGFSAFNWSRAQGSNLPDSTNIHRKSKLNISFKRPLNLTFSKVQFK